MHLVVVMLLGMCVPPIATGFAEVDDVAEPVRAGTVSSHAQDGAEAEAVDAAPKGASPPPAPAKATGELTDGERLFQGLWQLTSYGSGARTGIYYEDGGTIVFATPAPGEPRLEAFTGLDEAKVMIERATRPVEGDGEKPR